MDVLNLQETIHSWDDWLDEWVGDVYPVFQKHGISLDTALNIYHQNLVKNTLNELLEKLNEEGEDKW